VRVCFVSSYPPNHARLSEYANNFIAELTKRPTIKELYVLADKSQSKNNGLTHNPKVKVLRVWKPDDIRSVLHIIRYIAKLRPDVVHFNVSFQSFGTSKLANVAGLSLIPMSRLLGFKVLTGIHTLAEGTDLKKFGIEPSLTNRAGILVATKLVLSAQTVVVLVHSYVKALKQRYRHQNVIYIPHGTQTSKTERINTEQKVILIFGHMGPHKGLPLLLEAYKEMLKDKLNVKLVVAGGNHPNFPSYLQQFTNQNIPNMEFLGYVPEKQLQQVFKTADVLVMPYLAVPGTSGVFHLASGYGTPIIASDLPEIREILSDGASAVLVPTQNSAALKYEITKLLFDKKKAREIVAKNLEFAKKRSWKTVAEAYEKAYIDLIKR
jgi:glycosyltransferase involved in cell wall biosynthesis